MLLLVKPQFWLSADLVNMLSSMREVIAEDKPKIHDAILAEFKIKKYPDKKFV